MAADVLAFEVLRQKAQAVGTGIHIGIVDLLRVAREHHLGAFSGSGEDRLHFVGRKVLGLVHDHVLLGDGAAPDVGERLDAEIASFFELSRRQGGAPTHIHVGGDDEIQVVVNGLHVRTQLFVHVAGQITQVPAHGHDGAAYQQFVVALIIHDLHQARGDGQ